MIKPGSRYRLKTINYNKNRVVTVLRSHPGNIVYRYDMEPRLRCYPVSTFTKLFVSIEDEQA